MAACKEVSDEAACSRLKDSNQVRRPGMGFLSGFLGLGTRTGLASETCANAPTLTYLTADCERFVQLFVPKLAQGDVQPLSGDRGGARAGLRGRRLGGRGAGTGGTQRPVAAAVNPVGRTVGGSGRKLS
jgi:hypothetical protein